MTYSLCLSLLAELQTLCKEFHKRIASLEGDKYDLEWRAKMKNLEVTLVARLEPTSIILEISELLFIYLRFLSSYFANPLSCFGKLTD